MEHVKTLIVGGGISGLCAALSLGSDALILEAEAEPGGYCRSIRQDGFVWDFAGHFFHFKTEAGRRFFLSQFAPEELVEKEKRCRILYRGALIGYPFQTNIHELDKAELIDCLYDLVHRPESAACGSFLDLLYGSYGRAITEKFLRPYNEKLYACDLRTLDPGAMGRFFPAASLTEIIDNMKQPRDSSYNSRFFYPKNGTGALIERLCRQLPPGALLTGRRLVALDAANKTAIDSGGDSYRFDTLISTAPLDRLLSLLGDADDAAFLSANQVLVLNLGFEKKPPLPGIDWLYIPGPEARYYRVGFYDSVQGGDRASLYVELGFPAGARIEPEAELENTLSALRAQGLIQPDNRLLSHRALWMDPAYVHLRPDTEGRLRRIKAALARQDIHCLGRYGGWRYCSMEDCMLEAMALSERFKQGGAR